MLWDTWPDRQSGIYYYLKLFNCKIVFVTVRSFAEKIRQDLSIKAYWIPEGIDIKQYNGGSDLNERPFDVLELGRQKEKYHTMLESLYMKNIIEGYARNEYHKNGNIKKLFFPKSEDLKEGMPKYKIVVSFPRIDTHPKQTGNMETLTQRYWEAMLSKCLIVGRAPQELIDLLGYNPVIDVDWEAFDAQLISILSNIGNYQEFVNKNYDAAIENASWNMRVACIRRILKGNGYEI